VFCHRSSFHHRVPPLTDNTFTFNYPPYFGQFLVLTMGFTLGAHPYNLNYKVATVLAQICSQPTGLPQGAPTSPIVSNMLCARMDSQLQTLAKRHYCYYTRYADDLTFSTSRRKFPAALAAVVTDDEARYLRVGDDLRSIINDNGFKINEQKVRLQTRNKRQEVTGLTTNEFVNVNRKYIRQIRAMLHAWKKHGYAAAENEYQRKYCYKQPDKPYKKSASFQQVVKGKIEFVGMVRGREDRIFIRLNNQAAHLERDSTLVPYLFSLLEDPDDEISTLIAGGKQIK
jgi:RNA-directed DNA polymerase